MNLEPFTAGHPDALKIPTSDRGEDHVGCESIDETVPKHETIAEDAPFRWTKAAPGGVRCKRRAEVGVYRGVPRSRPEARLETAQDRFERRLKPPCIRGNGEVAVEAEKVGLD